MVDFAHPVSFDIAKQQAAAVIGKIIAGTPLQNTQGESTGLLSGAEVKLNTRLAYERGEPDLEMVRVELSGPAVAERLVASREALEKALQNLPMLKAHVKFGDDDQEATTTRTLIGELINAGVELPKEVMKWAGFSHENNEGNSWWHESQHTTKTTMNGHGITVAFNLPEHLPNGVTMNDVKENFEKRKDAILDMLADRIAKYKGVRGNKEEVEKIRAALGELDMEVFSSGSQPRDDKMVTGEFKITFRSKVQKEAKDVHDKEHPNDPVDANPELSATNILTTIQPLELSKAMNRAMLTAGEGALDMAMNIAGAKDIYRMLEKSFDHYKQSKPELAEKMNEVLASTLFDDNNAKLAKSEKHETKQRLRYESGDSSTLDKIIVDIPLPKDLSAKFIREVAAMVGPEAAQAAVTQQQVMMQVPEHLQHQFGSVDSMQLVGIHAQNPAVHQALQQSAAPLVGKQVPANKAEGFAQNIIRLIEEAHEQVQTGMKTLAADVKQRSDKGFEQQLAKDVGAPDPFVTPQSVQASQQPKLDVNSINWAEKLAGMTGQQPGAYSLS